MTKNSKDSTRNHPFSVKLIFNARFPCCEEQWRAVDKIDSQWVGTPNYMGFSYFWDLASGIKHILRDATPAERVKVHELFMAKGIPFHVDEDSRCFIANDEAIEIAKKVCKTKGRSRTRHKG